MFNGKGSVLFLFFSNPLTHLTMYRTPPRCTTQYCTILCRRANSIPSEASLQKFTHNPLFRSKYCHTPPSFVTCTPLSTTTRLSRSGGPPGVFVVPSYLALNGIEHGTWNMEHGTWNMEIEYVIENVIEYVIE
jgi:hypothetical protein